jgi:hypothetical protein
MKTIYKYKLKPYSPISMPIGAKPICVASQGDDVCMWCEVKTENIEEIRVFEVIGTGKEIAEDIGINNQYIGTAFLKSLVIHVYERI